MVMVNSKNSRVFNFAFLLKSRKFDAREIYMFYSIANVVPAWLNDGLVLSYSKLSVCYRWMFYKYVY